MSLTHGGRRCQSGQRSSAKSAGTNLIHGGRRCQSDHGPDGAGVTVVKHAQTGLSEEKLRTHVAYKQKMPRRQPRARAVEPSVQAAQKSISAPSSLLLGSSSASALTTAPDHGCLLPGLWAPRFFTALAAVRATTTAMRPRSSLRTGPGLRLSRSATASLIARIAASAAFDVPPCTSWTTFQNL